MKQVNVIRHLAFEDLGCFADEFAARGLPVRYFDAGRDDLEGLGVDDDLLVILGGPISANDNAWFDFIDVELTLLAGRIAGNKPTLGICLGSQLIARAAGAKVYPGAAKEIGWAPVMLEAADDSNPLNPLADNGGMVLHWHGETFDLPTGAERLASSAITPNQAFRLGRAILGLQFHLEVTGAGLESWYIGHIGEIMATDGVSVNTLREQAARHAEAAAAAGRSCLGRWLDTITP
jgi:GMP synthase (glutamine-hydrolysing)